jgi:hypothetical protein
MSEVKEFASSKGNITDPIIFSEVDYLGEILKGRTSILFSFICNSSESLRLYPFKVSTLLKDILISEASLMSGQI